MSVTQYLILTVTCHQILPRILTQINYFQTVSSETVSNWQHGEENLLAISN